MPSIKDIKDELKKLGITKGYSKFTKSQLEVLLKKAKEPYSINTLQEKKDLLKTISKKDLLKVISLIRIRNYYHLKHDELVELIASKYWEDFHTRWFDIATKNKSLRLPYKPYGIKPKPKPKTKVETEEKEEEKHNTILPELTKKDVEIFIRNQAKLSSSEPVMYSTVESFSSLMMMYLLEQTKNECAVPSRTGLYFTINAPGDRIQIDSDELEKIYKAYEKCKKKNKILVIPITIDTGKTLHANMLIINFHRNEVERFEPHGRQTIIQGVHSIKIDKSISSLLVDEINKKYKTNWKYVPPSKLCPTLGFQAYEQYAKKKRVYKNNIWIQDPGGYCLAWSYFYALLRLKFPKIDGSELIKESFKVLKTDPERLRNFIRGQVKFVYDLVTKGMGKGFMENLLELLSEKKELDALEKINELDNYLKKQYKKFTV